VVGGLDRRWPADGSRGAEIKRRMLMGGKRRRSWLGELAEDDSFICPVKHIFAVQRVSDSSMIY
jgi:hypothetical protein